MPQPNGYPIGWFQVAWSADVAKGEVKQLHYFGRDLVAFRGNDGVVHVLDAYCQHLGASLAHGGCVTDEGIQERLPARERTELEFARRDEAREIRDALEQLPDEQSRVIELAYYGGMTHVEIATMLDAPVGTIKGRMRLGLAKMRMALGDPAEVTQ